MRGSENFFLILCGKFIFAPERDGTMTTISVETNYSISSAPLEIVFSFRWGGRRFYFIGGVKGICQLVWFHIAACDPIYIRTRAVTIQFSRLAFWAIRYLQFYFAVHIQSHKFPSRRINSKRLRWKFFFFIDGLLLEEGKMFSFRIINLQTIVRFIRRADGTDLDNKLRLPPDLNLAS